MKKPLKIVLACSLTLLCFSCYYDNLDDLPEEPPVVIPPEEDVTFSNSILPIFEAYNCVECHNGGSLNPDLRPDNAYSSLIPTYVEAGNSSGSRLYTKLAEGHRNISDLDLALIKEWIDRGAENN